MEDLQKLMNEISEWSDKTFGESQRNPAIVHHLKKEVDELIDALNKSNALVYADSIGNGNFSRTINEVKMEYADCFMLLLDSAAHFGMTSEDLIKVTKEKLEINKCRKWGNPDKNGVVEHITE